MSSLMSILSIASSGLSAASTQLEVVSSNITSADVDGYTRKTATVNSANLGQTGGGVKVTGFTRATDTALFSSLSSATSDSSYRDTQNEYLQDVMDTLGLSSSDNPALSSDMTAFVNAWTTLESEPESTANQQQTINAATNLTDQIQSSSSDIEDIDRQCSAEINTSVSDLNSYLGQIADIDTKIKSAANTGGTASANLQDQRDQIILKVAKYVNVNVIQRDDGQVALYTTGGYQLLDGNSVGSFAYDGTNLVSNTDTSTSLNSALTGGSLQALVDFRDTSSSATNSATSGVGVIQKMRDQLDLIASALTTTTTTATSGEETFASAYASGTTASGELSAGFFTGTNRTDITVNSSLTDGTLKVKKDSVGAVVDSLMDATRTFSTSGLSESGSSYSSLVSSSLTNLQQSASDISSLNTTATNMQKYLSQKYTNATNVTVDDEMVRLVTLQNIYSANAKVLTTVQSLFQVLANTVQA